MIELGFVCQPLKKRVTLPGAGVRELLEPLNERVGIMRRLHDGFRHCAALVLDESTFLKAKLDLIIQLMTPISGGKCGQRPFPVEQGKPLMKMVWRLRGAFKG
ncbi:MAG TPA: hypothetical protein VM937_09750 [Burkholderiaceae bacterium]|nr:hypothetical protein [Burkholderiaceae bacterium]